MKYKLEVVVFNITSCLIARRYAPNRIELCDNPSEGGTTCSYGLLLAARELLAMALFPIVRPRGGDFLYDENEFRIMQKDVALCKDIGCDGVVTGLLNPDGSVDKKRVALLVQGAYPMTVTFHRAFDRAANPFEAMEDIIETGCERILTSGQRPTALEGAGLIQQLVRQAGHRIVIMPGSGVNAANLAELAEKTGASEFHSSARTSKTSAMDFVNDSMQEDLHHVVCDGGEISKMVSVLKGLAI